MQFLAKIAPKARAAGQIRAIESFLNLFLQPLRRESTDFFLCFPSAEAFTNHVTGVQVCAGLKFPGYELFQAWSQSNVHRGRLAHPNGVVKNPCSINSIKH